MKKSLLFILGILIIYFISLGADYGFYGSSTIADDRLQPQFESTWCLFAAMQIFIHSAYSQCELATEYVKMYFEDDSFPINCCEKLPETHGNYETWCHVCLNGVPWYNIPLFVHTFTGLRNHSQELINHVKYGDDYTLQHMFPCLGLDYTESHAIVLCGVGKYKTNTVGSNADMILVYYYDPWYGKVRSLTLYSNTNHAIYCMVR